MDKLQTAAIEQQKVLHEAKADTTKTEVEKQQAQNDFNNAMKTRKDEIDLLTKKTDKTPEETTQLAAHSTKYKEMEFIVTKEKIEIAEVVEETKTKTNILADEITTTSIATLS